MGLGTGALRWSTILGDLALCAEVPLKWGGDIFSYSSTFTMQGVLDCIACVPPLGDTC